MKCLGEIEMKSLLKVTELFIGWLLGGLYDFAALPIAVFKHMNCKDVEAVENIPRADLGGVLGVLKHPPPGL